MRLILFTSLAFAVGCSTQSAGPPAAATARGSSHDDHVHERGKMQLADAGQYHAALTAHLAKSGNELDVFFETADKDPKPVAIAVKSFTATAKRADGKEFELTFEPAPADERPKDEPAGMCSHFVAKAPWLTAEDVRALKAAGLTGVIAATLEEEDLDEDEAARRIVEAMRFTRVEAKPPSTGRVNLHATDAGVFTVDAAMVDGALRNDLS